MKYDKMEELEKDVRAQREAQADMYDGSLEELAYVALEFVGEAGEVANEVKKAIREGGLSSVRRELLVAELGDSLWCLVNCLMALDLDVDDVAEPVIDKLKKRRQLNTAVARLIQEELGDE